MRQIEPGPTGPGLSRPRELRFTKVFLDSERDGLPATARKEGPRHRVQLLSPGPVAPGSDWASCTEDRGLGEGQSPIRQIEPGPSRPPNLRFIERHLRMAPPKNPESNELPSKPPRR
jgi:hypothetical protein